MTPHPEDVLVLEQRIERAVIAIGGELQADAEQILLEHGSRPADLWGANYYPGRGREGCIEFTSLINIRIRTLTFALVGAGEPL